ncbi:unnamed protein product [Polarella glacialis]|uniref:Uncharacterized protein n=1 Tax=Polarella glacialis TaxID=89957 RepID=A0A813K6S4_POLGL|nr:unnamed protein product [Polarella glacialis]
MAKERTQSTNHQQNRHAWKSGSWPFSALKEDARNGRPVSAAHLCQPASQSAKDSSPKWPPSASCQNGGTLVAKGKGKCISKVFIFMVLPNRSMSEGRVTSNMPPSCC